MFTKTQSLAEHGIATAEYVFKLTEGDPGWEDTVQSWIVAYEPYLLREKIDCGDYDPAFVWFIENRALNIDRRHFCAEQGWGNVSFLPLGIATSILAVAFFGCSLLEGDARSGYLFVAFCNPACLEITNEEGPRSGVRNLKDGLQARAPWYEDGIRAARIILVWGQWSGLGGESRVGDKDVHGR